jgi:electron transfer flavoprotein alpha/beta subunit
LTEITSPPARGRGQTVTATDPVAAAQQIVDFLRERKLLS